MKTFIVSIVFLLAAGSASAQPAAPTCEDLLWSAQVIAANPDVAKSCQGVYVRNEKLFAKVEIELTRVRGNRLTFRAVHNDGSMGTRSSVTVPSSWRANIDGESYRARELLSGQRLNVYLPEDRFAFLMHDEDFEEEPELIEIEEATVVVMPKTASSQYAIALSGALLLLSGYVFNRLRRRWS